MTAVHKKDYEVIIVGGSYAGLSAAMALGRSLRQVLVVDDGRPCNSPTPHSHNFLTRDGSTPAELSRLAREQVLGYDSVRLLGARAVRAAGKDRRFEVEIDDGEVFFAGKLIFATGVRDLLPDIPGFAQCWGISVIHCPYCHGYEVRGRRTGILGNGEYGYEFARLISNWTQDLTLYTDGPSVLRPDQATQLGKHGISIVETPVSRLEHCDGYLEQIVLADGGAVPVSALYARVPFEQHCALPVQLGCGLTEHGYLVVDGFQQTTVAGVFACGDNTSPMRAVSVAVAAGTMAGAAVNRELVQASF